MNSITDLLDLEDTDITITDIQIQGQTKTLFLESKPVAHYCPSCGYKMHSLAKPSVQAVFPAAKVHFTRFFTKSSSTRVSASKIEDRFEMAFVFLLTEPFTSASLCPF